MEESANVWLNPVCTRLGYTPKGGACVTHARLLRVGHRVHGSPVASGPRATGRLVIRVAEMNGRVRSNQTRNECHVTHKCILLDHACAIRRQVVVGLIINAEW